MGVMLGGMKLRVRFAETDQMGVAHHSAYVVWLEAARVEWMRERGLSYRQIEENGLSLAVSKIEVEYRAAAYFDDELTVSARLQEARSRRVVFSYTVERGGQVLAHGASFHVPTTRTGRATTLPSRWLQPLTALLADNP